MIKDLLHNIADGCGIKLTHYEAVSGGDINEAYCLHSDTRRYFLKLNDAIHFPAMFEAEADGLDALRRNSSIVVPEVMGRGVAGDKQWLLLQWIDKGSPHKNSIENFGAALAIMHKQPQPFFGWRRNNYIGSLTQLNAQQKSWMDFYTQCRIIPLVKTLSDKNIFTKADTEHAMAFCKRLNDLFPPEAPVLLHGDLWGGNYMINSEGNAVIFDPAVYNGHREMDIGMTKLFGGFPQQFYDAYNETYPLEKAWQGRLPLTQLYPLLVHAVLFGGHYIANVKEIIKEF